MNDITTSALAARLALQKQYNATMYKSVIGAVNAYSRMLGKTLAGYAEVDAATAGLLQGAVYLALQGEHQGREIDHMAVRAVVYPIVFPPPKTGPKVDAEAEAVRLLEALAVMEDQTARGFADAARTDVAEDLATILHLGHAGSVSSNRAREMRAVVAQIRAETYWTRPAPVIWHCLQCGIGVKSAAAFGACPCCQASRAYAAS